MLKRTGSPRSGIVRICSVRCGHPDSYGFEDGQARPSDQRMWRVEGLGVPKPRRPRAVSRSGRVEEHVDASQGLGPALDAEAEVDVLEVFGNRRIRESEHASDLVVTRSCRHLAQDL